jgi:release factor glutamine methyltransferase
MGQDRVKLSDAQQMAARTLAESGVADPRREANSILAFAISRDLTFLIAHPEYELNEREEFDFLAFVQRRTHREPLQHITGKQEFYGLDFVVSPDVLIPRPETELIVENALMIIRDIDSPRLCEIGTGSGCITVSILNQCKEATAVCADISEAALEVAILNAKNHGVADRITFLQSDVFSKIPIERFDLLVSNPPYIPESDIEHLQPEVGRFEPRSALTDGGDGLSIIRRIVSDAPAYLVPGGYLLMEIGFSQSEQVREMFDASFWEKAGFVPDLQGIPRMLKARLAL